MTAEVPDNYDRSKSDSDIAKKIEEFKQDQLKEKQPQKQSQKHPEEKLQGQQSISEEVKAIFPEPKIEILGMQTLSKLELLIGSMSAEELDKTNENEDVLINFYNNDEFVREKITPLVADLLYRTTQLVYLTANEKIGYAYSLGSEDDETKPGVYLLLEEDNVNENDAPVYGSEKLQEIWDTSNRHVRFDIKSFAAYSKSDVIDMFYRFARDYAYPKVDFDSQQE